jgi:hypothetical protein
VVAEREFCAAIDECLHRLGRIHVLVAHASALVSGGVLPELTYKQAVATFGEEGTAEFINLVGLYCMVSVTLNGFDVPTSESATSGA